MKTGWLIAFEGLDGSGKSTQAARLAERLRRAGHRVVLTREPTEGTHGRRIREMARSGQRVSAGEELRWFVADRREHVAHVIRPGLEAGAVVVTDRYFLSTVAYQGARGLEPQQLLAESEAEFPLPHLALFLDVDPEQGLARVGDRRGVREPAFEERRFLARVAEIFRSLALAYLVRIDARDAADTVERQVRAALRERLSLP